MPPAAEDAFDRLAADYDRLFDENPIGSLMRKAVRRRLEARFAPGRRILELNCGTGEDAIFLALRGVPVLATDRSLNMIEVCRGKADRRGVSGMVEFRPLGLEELGRLEGSSFDGVLSNFGGLNCVEDLPATGRSLARLLRPGALALFCVMGPWVPWEWYWFLDRREPEKAFRRLGKGGVEWRGRRIHYPSIRRFRKAFPEFALLRAGALGALIPPPYAHSWATRHPRALRVLHGLERALERVPPLPWLADHYVLEMRRR